MGMHIVKIDGAVVFPTDRKQERNGQKKKTVDGGHTYELDKDAVPNLTHTHKTNTHCHKCVLLCFIKPILGNRYGPGVNP